jgi:hypothetical protein
MKKIAKPIENFAGIDYSDLRINKRVEQVVEDLTNNSQEMLFSATGSRSNAKAAYRLLANKKFTTEKLAKGNAEKVVEMMAGEPVVLLVQDTTDTNYNTHKKTKGLGYSSEKVLGIKIHTCLAMSEKGVPFGVMAQNCFTREKSKNEMSNSEKSKRPIEEKESNRWLETMRETTAQIPESTTAITICDRECDFYEFYNEAKNIGEYFIVRIVNNRVTESGEKVRQLLENAVVAGTVSVNIPRDSRRNIPARVAEMDIAFVQVDLVKPVIRKEEHINASVTLTVVQIKEKNPPDGIKPIEWFLATNVPITNAQEAFKVVEYYVQRWKIERFHHVLKSGCNIEKIQQRSYDRIVTLILIYSVIASYILAMTLTAQASPDATCDIFFPKRNGNYCLDSPKNLP